MFHDRVFSITILLIYVSFYVASFASFHSSGAHLHNDTMHNDSFPAADIHVVIARYKEKIDHLDWMKKYPHTLYNRGDFIFNESSYRKSRANSLHIVNLLENVGRESFIYLSHIVRYYHQLPNITVFSQAVQGKPLMYNDFDLQDDVEQLVAKRKFLTKENDGFAFCYPECQSAMLKAHMNDLARQYGGRNNILIMRDGYKKLLNFTVDYPRFAGMGCFFVAREAIHRNPREYYMKLARLVGSKNHPIEGHFFERAWPEVFHSNCSASVTFHCLLNRILGCPLPEKW